MNFERLSIPGCVLITPALFQDARGSFVKTFVAEAFRAHGLCVDYPEEFYSVSRRGVLRGLHFQVPPHDHHKLVYCAAGEVLDAVVDLRRGSPTYEHSLTVNLSAANGRMLYVPRGCAHGFLALSDDAAMFYKTSTAHAPEHDRGLRWDSAGIGWPETSPLMSERDRRWPALAEFDSPFTYSPEAG